MRFTIEIEAIALATDYLGVRACPDRHPGWDLGLAAPDHPPAQLPLVSPGLPALLPTQSSLCSPSPATPIPLFHSSASVELNP